MLNLLIPPIIVVAGLVLLFWLFSKKKEAIRKLEVAEPIARKTHQVKEYLTQRSEGLGESMRSFSSSHDVVSRFVQVLVNGVKRLRSAATGLLGKLKGLRKSTPDFKSSEKESFLEKEKAFEEFGQSQKQKAKGVRRATSKPQTTRRPRAAFQSARKIQKERPMVSEEVVHPEASREKTQSQYEEILIERIAMNPRDIEAYERLGDYYIEQESYEDAKECYKQVLRLSPVNRKAKIRMRRLEKILGR